MRLYETRFCERCQCDREFSRRAAAHKRHLGLTIATLGLWGVGWLWAAMAARKRPWRCTSCRSRFVPSEKRNPQWKQPTVEQRRLPVTPRQST